MYGRVHWEFSNPGILVSINFNFFSLHHGKRFSISLSCLEYERKFFSVLSWSLSARNSRLVSMWEIEKEKISFSSRDWKKASRRTLMYGNVCSPMETWLCHDQTFEFAFSKVRNCQQQRGGNIFRLPKEEKYAIDTIYLPWKGLFDLVSFYPCLFIGHEYYHCVPPCL